MGPISDIGSFGTGAHRPSRHMFGRDPAASLSEHTRRSPDNRPGYSFVTDDQTRLDDPNRPLRHRAFFSAAGEHQEGSHDYRALLAGLLVLRLLDKWPKPSDATPEENDARIASGPNRAMRLLKRMTPALPYSYQSRMLSRP
jgi:hypothetical protein